MAHIKLLQEHFLPKTCLFLENLRIVTCTLQKWLFSYYKNVNVGETFVL